MPDHDHDLIAALAEGRLEPDRAAEAERVITADPGAAELLAAHRRALGAIAASAPASLTDDERRDLRMRVSDAVGLDRTHRPPARRRAPWAAVAIAGATLAALVAAVPLMDLLSDSSDSVAITAGIPETDEISRSASEAGESTVPTEFGAAAESDGVGDDPVSTTAAVLSTPTAQESLSLAERLSTLLAEPQDDDERLSPTEGTACGTEAAEEIGAALEELRYAEMTIDDRQTMVFFTVVDGMPASAAAFSADECQLIESLP